MDVSSGPAVVRGKSWASNLLGNPVADRRRSPEGNSDNLLDRVNRDEAADISDGAAFLIC